MSSSHTSTVEDASLLGHKAVSLDE